MIRDGVKSVAKLGVCPEPDGRTTHARSSPTEAWPARAGRTKPTAACYAEALATTRLLPAASCGRSTS